MAMMPDAFDLPTDLVDIAHRVSYDLTRDGTLEEALDQVIAAAPDI